MADRSATRAGNDRAASQIGRIDFIDRGKIIEKINAEFAALDPDYAKTKQAFQDELAPLKTQMLALQDSGEPVWRSQQILSEAIWLNNHTVEWKRLHSRIADLRHSLNPDQVGQPDQRGLIASEDGGYHQGSEVPFIILDLTTDAVQRDDAPEKSLLFLKDCLDPGRLLAYLYRLQITDIAATGVNCRSELGSVESSFLQFLIKPKLRCLLSDRHLWEVKNADDISFRLIRLSETYEDFLNQTQHPRTGYWGPWYRIGGELLQLHDLSFTFHVVNYRKGDVSSWHDIIETTLEIGRLGLLYPYGWKPSDSPSPYSNHHNADVITLFEYGFDKLEVDEFQKHQIGDVVYNMLNWCLTKSLMRDSDSRYCGFEEVDEYNTTQKFGFGVGFLQTAGFFEIGKPFWWDPSREREPWWPDPCAVAEGLLKAVNRLNVDSSFTDDIRETLRSVLDDPACRPGESALRPVA